MIEVMENADGEPPIKVVKSAPVIKADSDKHRIEVGLDFFRPLLWLVGGSIVLLIGFMGYVEIIGSQAVIQLYREALQKASTGSNASDPERLRAFQEFAVDARENLQAFRAGWQQLAQLILVNLLLPVLTALLGYIFGVQQGRASEAAERNEP